MAGPNGHRWRTARATVLAQSTICHLCLHDGADQVDHLESRASNPTRDVADPTNLLPIHGVNGCPTCGEKCNQVKGSGLRPARPRRSRDW